VYFVGLPLHAVDHSIMLVDRIIARFGGGWISQEIDCQALVVRVSKLWSLLLRVTERSGFVEQG